MVSSSFSGPRDISESVIQASSASLAASRRIHSKGGGLAEESAAGTEFRDVSRAVPEVLISICNCGGALKGPIDTGALEEWLNAQDFLGQVHFIDHICTQEGRNDQFTDLYDSIPRSLWTLFMQNRGKSPS